MIVVPLTVNSDESPPTEAEREIAVEDRPSDPA